MWCSVVRQGGMAQTGNPRLPRPSLPPSFSALSLSLSLSFSPSFLLIALSSPPCPPFTHLPLPLISLFSPPSLTSSDFSPTPLHRRPKRARARPSPSSSPLEAFLCGLPGSLLSLSLSLSLFSRSLSPSQSKPSPLPQAKTGTGKTLAFLIPAVERLCASPLRGVGCLVVSPTRELAAQTAEEAVSLCTHHGYGVQVSVSNERTRPPPPLTPSAFHPPPSPARHATPPPPPLL